jgi:DNA-binding transcriptional regulator/RsmH inhibitor MraZ
LREYASLNGEAVVTGLNTYVEVWNPDAWGEESERVEGYDVNIEAWKELEI